MNVTTFTPASRRRFSLPVSGIGSIFKKIVSKPKRIVFIVVAILAVVGLFSIFSNRSDNSAPSVLALKQSFTVNAKTQDGRSTNGTLKIDVIGTYKDSSLLVQGTRVSARNGKQFLIINMEITNQYNLPLYTYPVDTFRLVTADGKKYAPTAHQSNVEIRPQATKSSNVGFIVPLDQKKFKIEVGELTGDKTLLEFSLPK